MELPKRAISHISETASVKLFNNCIPNEWVIRELTEKDYGIDCYTEIVNNQNQLTGKLISIQLKSREGINWTQQNYYTLSDINISTTNYWFQFSVPVFLCVTDTKNNEAYFINVKEFIRMNYQDYSKQVHLSYKVFNSNVLQKSSINNFLKEYEKEHGRQNFETAIVTFVSNINHIRQFIDNNMNRDFFMRVENSRSIMANYLMNLFYELCFNFSIPWDLKTFKEYKSISQKFGNDYDLYEEQLNEILSLLDSKVKLISKQINTLITVTEKHYWIYTNLNLYNFVNNMDSEGNFPEFDD